MSKKQIVIFAVVVFVSGFIGGTLSGVLLILPLANKIELMETDYRQDMMNLKVRISAMELQTQRLRILKQSNLPYLAAASHEGGEQW